MPSLNGRISDMREFAELLQEIGVADKLLRKAADATAGNPQAIIGSDERIAGITTDTAVAKRQVKAVETVRACSRAWVGGCVWVSVWVWVGI
jgi:hypothetical protein